MSHLVNISADSVKSKLINNDTAIMNDNGTNVSQVDNPEKNHRCIY